MNKMKKNIIGKNILKGAGVFFIVVLLISSSLVSGLESFNIKSTHVNSSEGFNDNPDGSVDLYEGWNLIGWNYPFNTTASSLAENISNCTVISRWDSINGTYKTYIVGGPPTFDFNIESAIGLFVLVSENSYWYPAGYFDGHSLDAADGDPVDVVYVDDIGNVGIGTTTPTKELEVVGAIEADGFTINNIPVGTSNDSYWSSLESDLFYYGCVTIGSLDLGRLLTRGGHQPRENVQGDLVVSKSNHGVNGIGNITAWGHMNANGSIHAGGHLNSTGNVNAGGHVKANGSIHAKGHLNSSGNVNAGGHINSNGSIHAKGHMESDGNITANGNISAGYDLIVGRWLRFLTGGMGIMFPDGSIQNTAAMTDDEDWIKTGNDMYANVSGNVGIGTSSPNEKLHVVGNANITGTISAHNFSGNSDITFINETGDEIVTMKNNGNVGIGTENPSEILTIIDEYAGAADEDTNILIGHDQNINFGFLGWHAGSNPYLYLSTYDYEHDIILFPASGSYSGNVGIGVENPGEKLHVKGNTYIDGNLAVTGIINDGVTKYLSIHPCAFKPENSEKIECRYNDSIIEITYMDPSQTQAILFAPLELPNGSTIHSIKTMIKDQTINRYVHIHLREQALNSNTGNNYYNLNSPSPGAPGEYYEMTSDYDLTIDNSQNVYSIVAIWNPGGDYISLGVHNVRIEYT